MKKGQSSKKRWKKNAGGVRRKNASGVRKNNASGVNQHNTGRLKKKWTAATGADKADGYNNTEGYQKR